MSNNGWKEAKWDLTPQQFKEYAELEKRQNLERFRDEQIGAGQLVVGTAPKELFDEKFKERAKTRTGELKRDEQERDR